MRSSAAFRTLSFLFMLLVISLASSGLPIVHAQDKVGEIILSPTHAVRGTLVAFEGVGWQITGCEVGCYCIVDGYPVKVDSHAICKIVRRNGPFVPVGTFIVKDVPTGTYPIFVYTPAGTGEAEFTVDAGQPIAEFPSFLIMLPVILGLTILLRRERNRRCPATKSTDGKI